MHTVILYIHNVCITLCTQCVMVLLNRFHGTHKCPFGSTSVRTAPLIRKDEINGPGPARYQQKMVADGERGREREGETSRPSYTFASTSSRLYCPPSIVTVRHSHSLHTHTQ